MYTIRKVSWSVQFWWFLLLYLTQILLCAEVPDDVFAPNFLWKGSYDYKGQKQPLTLTVSSFNATSGKVNATLADSSVEFLLSGEASINHRSLACTYFEKVLRMHQSTTKPSHAPECKFNFFFLKTDLLACAHCWPHEDHQVLRQPPLFRPLFCPSVFYYLLFFALCFCTASSLHTVLGLYVVGIYKRQEARLMLLRYQMRALAHSSLSRITDESWAMDGFVSILCYLLQLVGN